MHSKDFVGWHILKARLDNLAERKFIHERQIWWVAVGVNIGFEEDGKGENWARPVVVIKKFNNRFFFGIPLSTSPKIGPYYFHLTYENGASTALLSQMRAFDAKRLINFEGWIPAKQYLELRGRVKQLF